MNDYTKFLSVKNQLQKFYNFKAKEEREIIYATKIVFDSQIEEIKKNFNNRNINLENKEEKAIQFVDLIAITRLKDNFYIELLKIEKDISFKFSSDFNMLLKLSFKSNEEISIKTGDKDMDIKFSNTINSKEFIWSIIKIVNKKKLENQVQIKGFNYKDLEDFAVKNKFYSFNKFFEEEKKKERYEVDISDKELSDLEFTLKSLNINSILSYDLENLNSKIEQFNIQTKESFLKRLQNEFAKDVIFFLGEIKQLDESIIKMDTSLEEDLGSISNIWHGIQKIEDANHHIELRNESKRKLQEFIHKLFEQLTISESKKENLISGGYLANSELMIISEIMDNFVKFFKSRKKQDIKMAIIKEGQDEIKSIIDLMILNFNKRMNDYIRSHCFQETFLLRNLPSFTNTKLIIHVKDIVTKLRAGRGYIESFLLDRRFFIEKLNQLVNNQDELNKNKIFSDCVTLIAKGMRDCLAMEFNGGIKILQFFFDSDILNPSKLDTYLDSDDLLKYDALEKMDSDWVYEINKYFTTFILNCFFSVDKCVEVLLSVFSEEPNFYLDKNSKQGEEIEKIVSQKIYEYLSKNFNTSIEKNILLGFVIYTILSAIQEKISKNVIEDMVILSVNDIFEQSLKVEESYMPSVADPDIDFLGGTNYNVNIEEIGIRKISIQETKTFINKNMKSLQGVLNEFFSEQKEIISNYVCEVRRVGIIPIVKKTCNLFNLLIALSKGIRSDYLVDVINEIRLKLRQTIERLSKVKPKYTNILMLENYYYLNKCFKVLEDRNINISGMAKIESDTFLVFKTFKEEYIKEIFVYQFKDFYTFYDKFNSQFNTLGDQIKMQSSFTFSNFDKYVTTFLKELPKNVEKMAKRVNKHLCKELGLAPVLWIDIQFYINKILKHLESIYKECYQKESDKKYLTPALDSINNFNFMNLSKK